MFTPSARRSKLRPLIDTIFSTCCGPVSVPETFTADPSKISPRGHRRGCGGWDSHWPCSIRRPVRGRRPGPGVDKRDLLVGRGREQTAQGRKLEYTNVFRRQLARHLDGQVFRGLGGQHPDQHAQLADQVQPRGDVLTDRTAGDVDRVGTNSPASANFTLSATSVPARSWASDVDAPRCGVTTTSATEQRTVRAWLRWRTRRGRRRGRGRS